MLFVILCDGCFFTAEKKGEKRDVSNNKLYQILGRVYTIGERGILGEAREKGRRKIKRLLPVHCSGCYYAGYVYTKGRIACKLLNAIFYCGKSTKVYCYRVLLALV